MKLYTGLLLFLIALLSCGSLFGQVHISGSVQSSLYLSENTTSEQQWDYYQGLRLRLIPDKQPNINFSTFLRLARRGDPASWDEKVYSAALNWKSTNRRLGFRLGRQFVYKGVINGTMDAVMLSAHPQKNLKLMIITGTEAPYDRQLEVKNWDDGNVLGGYASYRFSELAKLDASYFRRARNGNAVWQLLGATLTGKTKSNLYYQAQFDYNLEISEYQGMRYRLSYYVNQWSISGEFNSQKPRIREDSFFRRFRLISFNQWRSGITYQAGDYQLGLQYFYTRYKEDDNNNQINLSLGSHWGVIGFIYQNGFGGDNAGIFGEVHYDVVPQLTLKLYSSYNNYERHSTDISENATAYSAGVHYRPNPHLQLRAELEESINSFYDNDLRGLFTLNYSFNL